MKKTYKIRVKRQVKDLNEEINRMKKIMVIKVIYCITSILSRIAELIRNNKIPEIIQNPGKKERSRKKEP